MNDLCLNSRTVFRMCLANSGMHNTPILSVVGGYCWNKKHKKSTKTLRRFIVYYLQIFIRVVDESYIYIYIHIYFGGVAECLVPDTASKRKQFERGPSQRRRWRRRTNSLARGGANEFDTIACRFLGWLAARRSDVPQKVVLGCSAPGPVPHIYIF